MRLGVLCVSLSVGGQAIIAAYFILIAIIAIYVKVFEDSLVFTPVGMFPGLLVLDVLLYVLPSNLAQPPLASDCRPSDTFPVWCVAFVALFVRLLRCLPVFLTVASACKGGLGENDCSYDSPNAVYGYAAPPQQAKKGQEERHTRFCCCWLHTGCLSQK